MKADTIERLTVSYFCLRDRLKKVVLPADDADPDDKVIDLAVSKVLSPDGEETEDVITVSDDDAPSSAGGSRKRSRTHDEDRVVVSEQ